MDRDVAAKKFKESLWKFKGESAETQTPKQVADEFERADNNVALLETAQQAYNLNVEVRLGGKPYSLSFAVKKVGGAGRLDKMWRVAATDTGRFSSYREMSRKADEEYAEKTVTDSDAIKWSGRASQFASSVREAIATGNSKEITMDLSSSLFE